MAVAVKTVQDVKVRPQVELEQTDYPKNVGLMGGTFNPIHQAHLIMAEQVYSKLNLDEVWFVPDNIPPHIQGKDAISAKDRIEMLKIATADNPHFKVEMIEILRGGVSYTIDTIKALKKRYPKINFYFIAGGDMISDLKNWRKPEELVELVKFVGVKRPGFVQKSDYPVIWVDAPFISLSSTFIRHSVRHGSSIKYLVPDKVIEYIEKEGLYLE